MGDIRQTVCQQCLQKYFKSHDRRRCHILVARLAARPFMIQKIDSLSNTWWLNYTFFTKMAKERKVRPMLYHRWGGLGNHRYQIGFSGDNYVTWKSLDFLPWFTATASNVCYGFWSHDLGGHYMAAGDTVTNPNCIYARCSSAHMPQ